MHERRDFADDYIMHADEAAKLIGVCTKTLHNMGQRGPKKVRISSKRIGYRHSDVMEWLANLEVIAA